MLVFEGGVTSLVGAPPVEAEAPPVQSPRVDLAQAAAIALARHPGSTVSGIASFPDEESGAYRIRLLKPGELRRAFGTTNVFVSAADGSVLADFNALKASSSRAFIDNLFPFHTGEIGGTIGRIIVLLLGLWLAAMIVLGIVLWRVRASKSPRRTV
jgi:uncharacterized iron-regulated membrane protein